MAETTYTERLGIGRPVLEDLAGRPELKLIDLLVACLFERGGPMAPQEVAERLAGLGVTARTGDLVLSLKRSAAGVASVFRDEEGRFCFALDCPQHELRRRLLQLGVREPKPGPKSFPDHEEEWRARRARRREEAARRRRVVLHAVPAKGEVGAAVLLDPETREVETFVGEELARLPEQLAGHDLVVGIQPERTLERLGIEPGEGWILVDLDRPQKTKSLPGPGRRVLRITNEILMAGTLGARRPLGDDATYRRYLAEGPPRRARRRLEADAKNLWAYYRFGVVNGWVLLRESGLDEPIFVNWSEPGYPSLEELAREAIPTRELLEVVVGAPPSWEDPWGETIVAEVLEQGEWDWAFLPARGAPKGRNLWIYEVRGAEPEQPPAVARRRREGDAAPGADRIAELEVTLAWSDPAIWRRVRVPCSFTLADLHWVIQAVFGWENSHLHSFEVRGERYEAPSPYGPELDEERALDASSVTLGELKLGVKGRRFEYVYDFGDHWLHEIAVLDAGPAEPGATYPLCVAGERAAPPEDCGGMGGYEQLIEILFDPQHPEHEEMLDWLGRELDPEHFDLDGANERLRQVFPPAG